MHILTPVTCSGTEVALESCNTLERNKQCLMHFKAKWYSSEKHDNGVGDVDSMCRSEEASRSLR